jgi:asparagine N-glycosylation enzyme membrane subunit Stt3
MIEMLLLLTTVALSLVLAGISFIAYRKSHLRPALYLLIAFLLFALKKVIEGLKLAAWIERDVGAVTGILEVLVLGLLVLSLWRR